MTCLRVYQTTSEKYRWAAWKESEARLSAIHAPLFSEAGCYLLQDSSLFQEFLYLLAHAFFHINALKPLSPCEDFFRLNKKKLKNITPGLKNNQFRSVSLASVATARRRRL